MATITTRARGLWVEAGPGVVCFAVLFVDGLAGGGYLPRTWRIVTFALCAFGVAALIGRDRVALARIERVFLGLLAGLTLWIWASQLWSDTPQNSPLEAERSAVYVVAAAVILLTVERSQVPVLLGGALAGVTAACAYGLGAYLFVGHELNPIQGNLLFKPIGYANGLGIYSAIGIVLAVGLGLALRQRRVLLACATALAVLLPTLFLTHSRAAAVSLALGIAICLRFGRPIPRRVGRLLPVGAAVAVLALASSVAGEHGVAGKLFGENRPDYWRVALKQYELNPVLGSGAGTFERYWLRYRPNGSFAREAHNLYLETLAELGPVGLALRLGALALPFVVLRRRDPLLATAAGGYVAFLVHAGVDWDWELPAVTLAGLACGSSMFLAARPDDAPELGGRARLALIAPMVALGVLALIRLETGANLPFA